MNEYETCSICKWFAAKEIHPLLSGSQLPKDIALWKLWDATLSRMWTVGQWDEFELAVTSGLNLFQAEQKSQMANKCGFILVEHGEFWRWSLLSGWSLSIFIFASLFGCTQTSSKLEEKEYQGTCIPITYYITSHSTASLLILDAAGVPAWQRLTPGHAAYVFFGFSCSRLWRWIGAVCQMAQRHRTGDRRLVVMLLNDVVKRSRGISQKKILYCPSWI